MPKTTVDHRRLQPGPQVDRPPRDAGGARDHRERPRTEKPQEHGHLQSQVDEGHRRHRRVAPDRDLLPPTVVLTQSNGFATGSARSVPGFDLYQAVESCPTCWKTSAGTCTPQGSRCGRERRGVHAEVQRLRRREHRSADARSAGGRRRRTALLGDHARIPPRAETVRPFGPGNAAPIFATRSVSNRGDAKLVGAECEHLRMDLTQRQKPNTTLQCIAFSSRSISNGSVGAAGGRMLSDRGEPLPRHGLDAAAHQGHQAGGEIARKRIAANRGCGFRIRTPIV